MKRIVIFTLMALAAATLLLTGCGSASHTAYFTKSPIQSDGLAQIAAPGQKVYIDWVDAEGGLSSDEPDDLRRLTRDYTRWNVVEKKSDAGFVLRLIQNKRWVLGSPSCWLTPEILTTDGRLLWRGDMTRGEANEFNGFRATDRCYKKMLQNVFLKEPALVPAIKTEEL
jgi:hypothetical protein